MQDAHADSAPGISAIIPARNAGDVIIEAIDSILAQDYPGAVEVIVADGSDTPEMAERVRRLRPAVRVIANPEQSIPAGLNAALAVARGEVVARCDAHSALPPGYLRQAVDTLQRTGAANVGGRQRPVGHGMFQRAVALAMTTHLGCGTARYRLGGPAGPIDTVYLGVFRRDALDAVGGFDPCMERNEDYELNWRLRARGETVWFDPALAVAYRPRRNLAQLARQYYLYGRWKRLMLRRHPASLLARHLAAPLLVLGLLAAVPLAWWGGAIAGAAIPATYALALAGCAIGVGVHRRDASALLLVPALLAIHLSWGTGFLLSPRALGKRDRTPRQ